LNITVAPRLSDAPADSAVIVLQFQGEHLDQETTDALRACAAPDFEDAITREELKGRLYATTLLRGSPSALVVGLGKRGEFSEIRCRRAVEAGARYLTRHGFHDISVQLPSVSRNGTARMAVEAVIRGAYDEGLLKTADREDRSVREVVLIGGDGNVTRQGEVGEIIGESTNFARDLVNLPPNDISPKTFAERLVEMAEEVGLGVEVLEQPGLSELNMGAILNVGKGSSEPPRVIDLRYGNEQAPVKLALVGKGLTFDSGGLSIKTAAGMEWMKGDMAGAAAVAGAMRAIGLLQPAGIHVRGIIGAVENMPGPGAMKPGDVLRTMNGKTIEVLNTDAEGRLVLADVLTYAVRRAGATHIVDLATLTGAIEVALGNEAAGVMGRPDDWVRTVVAAADRALERLWQMPLYPEYRQRMDSELADMKNTGGRPGGALNAASLLEEFVDGVPWAHMDIAGVAWLERKSAYTSTGATGYGVATLVELATTMAGEQPA